MTSQDDLLLALGRLEGKVDALISVQRTQDNTLNHHDKRIRSLENSRSLMLGAAAVIGALSSQLFELLGINNG
jgi:spore coat polysaccharide biosynthesis predicted glycosyltransferase SpsG